MPDLSHFVAGSTLAQWLIALFSGGTFAAVLTFVIKWRGQTIDKDETLREHYAKLDTEIRDHYAKQVAELRAERAADSAEYAKVEKHLRDMCADSDRRHEECEANRRAMRKEMDGMHDEIRGLKRQIPEASANKLLVMEGSPGPKPSDTAPDAAASAVRVKRITENGGDK